MNIMAGFWAPGFGAVLVDKASPAGCAAPQFHRILNHAAVLGVSAWLTVPDLLFGLAQRNNTRARGLARKLPGWSASSFEATIRTSSSGGMLEARRIARALWWKPDILHGRAVLGAGTH